MLDTNPNKEERMPPLIVLGLTGPVGSGCSAVSNQIIEGKRLLMMLTNLGWVTRDSKGGFSICYEGLNKDVDEQYGNIFVVKKLIKHNNESEKQGYTKKLEELRDELNSELEEKLFDKLKKKSQEELEPIEKDFTKKLREILEVREEIKALNSLKAYYRKESNLFYTISASTVIVLYALMAIEQDDFSLRHIKQRSRRRNCSKFVEIAKTKMNGRRANIAFKKADTKGYKIFYKNCRDWKDKDEEKLNKLADAFFDIYGIAADIKKEFQKKYPYDYTDLLQDFGDNIRRCGNPFDYKKLLLPDCSCRLAENIAQIIYLLYVTGRKAFFVVDCLRNPYEVIYLRGEFAKFFLLSLYAEEGKREERFVKSARKSFEKKVWKGKFEEDKVREVFETLNNRDSGKNLKGDEILYKQNITKCVQISHIAINNVTELLETKIDWSKDAEGLKKDIEKMQKNYILSKELFKKPLRVLCLILSPGCTKPNHDEIHMNIAYTMAVKSNCISRQVGAVIVGPKGYIVGAGWNDLAEGRISCGLRAIRDLKNEELLPHVRAISKKGKESIDEGDIEELIKQLVKLVKGPNRKIRYEQFCFCFKDEMAKKIVTKKIKEARDEINKKLKTEGKDEIKLGISTITKLVAKAEVHHLESCLALHAEENAIIQSSKIGGMGLKGGIVYTTAEPCTLCAKKIQQVGIKKVVYTVAYPKSLSEVYMKGVELEQFEGVKPRAYIRLFMPHHDQKEWQYLESRDLVPKI